MPLKIKVLCCMTRLQSSLTSFLGDNTSSNSTSSSSKVSENVGEGLTAGVETIRNEGVLGRTGSLRITLLGDLYLVVL